MFSYQNCIFDLDGTLINSAEEVLSCLKAAFAKSNYTVAEERFTHNVIGPPLKEIIKRITPELFDEKKILEILQIFRQIYDYDENDVSSLYEGVYELLTELKQNGCKLFMATFKPTFSTMRIVKHFQLNMFDDIYTIDKFDKLMTKEEMIEDIIRKHKLQKSETFMLGDAASDVIAARNTGVTAIGALWGYNEDKNPLIKNSDIVLKSIKELKTCLKSNLQTT